MKIFGIGDSRTGTTSLHYYLKAASIKSIHHYEWIFKKDESLTRNNHDGHVESLLDFISNSGYTAFIDQPTRKYYKELYTSYPDAFFINTVRSEPMLEKSVISYFGFDKDTAADFMQHHASVESEIEVFFSEHPEAKYLKIDITANSSASNELKTFLGIDIANNIEIGRENQSQQSWGMPYIDNLCGVAKMRLGFYSLFSPPKDSDILKTVEYLEQCCQPSKSMVSESSHHFLINDSSSSIRQYLALPGPANSSLVTIEHHFEGLQQTCDSVGSRFLAFAVPEKYSIYPEFLPRCLTDFWLSDIIESIQHHPSIKLGNHHPFFINLVPYLITKKGLGDLYYHGDTHTTSLGSLQILRIINMITMISLGLTPCELPNNFVTPVLGSWLGDLAAQTPEDIRSYYDICFSHNPNMPYDQSGFRNISYITHFPQNLPGGITVSSIPLDKYQFRSPERPKDIYKNPNAPISKKLLVFRDSTAKDIIPSLAMAYQHVTAIWDRAFDIRQQIILDEKPDCTLVITADRFVCYYKKSLE